MSEGKRVSEERRKVRPQPLSEEAWAPFGWLPVADTDPRDGEHRLSFAWDDVHVNLIGHARAEVPETGDGLRCQMLFRHDTHTQSVMSLDVPSVIAVAPAAQEFSGAADADSIRVFRLGPALQRPGTALCRGQHLRGPGLQGSRRRRGPLVKG